MIPPTPDEIARLVVALVAIATVWARIEPRLQELATTTESAVDDKIVAVLGYAARVVLIVFSPVEGVRRAIELAVAKREPRQ